MESLLGSILEWEKEYKRKPESTLRELFQRHQGQLDWAPPNQASVYQLIGSLIALQRISKYSLEKTIIALLEDIIDSRESGMVRYYEKWPAVIGLIHGYTIKGIATLIIWNEMYQVRQFVESNLTRLRQAVELFMPHQEHFLYSCLVMHQPTDRLKHHWLAMCQYAGAGMIKHELPYVHVALMGLEMLDRDRPPCGQSLKEKGLTTWRDAAIPLGRHSKQKEIELSRIQFPVADDGH